MDAMTAAIPPFETFYAEHAGVVLAHLRRRLGPQAAEDAFQETFLRALRAYGRLEHGDHLRSWALTIASNVAVDTLRRAGREHLAAEPPERVHMDGEPAFDEISDLTNGLPPKERAAVVLRYGYDMTYEEIAVALESSPDAARQAASSGVRRLRSSSGRSTT